MSMFTKAGNFVTGYANTYFREDSPEALFFYTGALKYSGFHGSAVIASLRAGVIFFL